MSEAVCEETSRAARDSRTCAAEGPDKSAGGPIESASPWPEIVRIPPAPKTARGGLRTLKHAIRESCTLLAIVLTAPLWIPIRLEAWLGLGESLFAAGSEFVSLFPGLLGVVIRRGFYRQTLDSFALDGSVGFLTTVAHREVEIAEGVYIGARCTLGRVTIEPHVTIGSNVDILSGRRQHGFSQADVPVQQQGGSFEQIRIGQNTWVGNSSVVMADIGAASVIGAGSVVVKAIPRGSVAVGNPAMVKRQRED